MRLGFDSVQTVSILLSELMFAIRPTGISRWQIRDEFQVDLSGPDGRQKRTIESENVRTCPKENNNCA